MRVRGFDLRRMLVLVFAPILFAATAERPRPAVDPEVTEAAEAWLALMDAGEYQESWEAAGEAFRSAIAADDWAQQAAAVRQQVGDIVSREDARVDQLADPPGAPPGEYAQVRYRSEFSAAGPVTELVVLASETDGRWRVVGYSIQPPSGA